MIRIPKIPVKVNVETIVEIMATWKGDVSLDDAQFAYHIDDALTKDCNGVFVVCDGIDDVRNYILHRVGLRKAEIAKEQSKNVVCDVRSLPILTLPEAVAATQFDNHPHGTEPATKGDV